MSEHQLTFDFDRWYKAPEILYGSKKYGPEIDIFAAASIFAELLNGEVLFKGNSDIDQLSKIHTILGTPTNKTWPVCFCAVRYPEMVLSGDAEMLIWYTSSMRYKNLVRKINEFPSVDGEVLGQEELLGIHSIHDSGYANRRDVTIEH